MAQTEPSKDGLKLDHAVTSGTFSLDGGTFDVDNNVWVLGNDSECVVFDASHDAAAIRDAVGDRKLLAVLCTHAHDDHINQVSAVTGETGASAYLHPDDQVLWEMVYPDQTPDQALADGQELTFAGARLQVLHTPGHSPGACCFYAPDLGVVFTGDTLFNGGPGATGRSFSDYPTIVDSIRTKLFALPDETVVKTGHGEDTTIGAERAGSSDWSDPNA